MANSRNNLKQYFLSGNRPTQLNFEDLIDSLVHLDENKSSITEVEVGTNDVNFVTPQGVKASVLKFAPVKRVNNTLPDMTGNVTITVPGSSITGSIAQSVISGLVGDLSGKQPTLISGSNIKTINGNNILGSGNLSISPPTTIYTVSVSVSNNSTTKILVPTLSCPIIAGKKYKIEVIGDFQTAALTTGVSIGFTSTGSATIKGQVELCTVQGSTSVKGTIHSINNSSSTPGSFVTSPSVSVINSPHFVVANIFLNCVGNGTFNVNWGSEVAGSAAVLNSGTVMIVTVLN